MSAANARRLGLSPIMKALDDLSHHIAELEAQIACLNGRLSPVMAAGGSCRSDPPDSVVPGSILSMIEAATYRIAALDSIVEEAQERMQL